MNTFDASHAYDNGFFAATRGFRRDTMPSGTWMTAFSADWIAGFDAAVGAGLVGAFCYRRKH